ncbi:hypothetical protein ABZP36_036269 [Zizania latifolia]
MRDCCSLSPRGQSASKDSGRSRSRLPDQPGSPDAPNPTASSILGKAKSARLATKPAMGSIQKAQVHLMRKMGILQDKEDPLEKALEKYLDLFKGPLTNATMEAILSLAGLSI